jgi:hypothetical protein
MMIRSFAAAIILTAFFVGGAVGQSEGVPASVPVSAADRKKADAGVLDAPADRADTKQTTSSSYTRPTAKKRFSRYVNSMVGPFSLARQVAASGIATWRNSPEEWGGQWEGFGKRLASNFGKNVIKQTTIYGLDEALKLDSGYYRATGKSTGAKIRNALISPVTARTPSGKRTIGIPRIAGTYAGNIIAREAWYPDRYDWKDAMRNGTISLGIGAAFNLFKEFVWKK